jgi:hypothetical protein
MIRKGQACWSAMGTGSGSLHRFIVGMFGIEVQFIRLSHPDAFASIVATLPFRGSSEAWQMTSASRNQDQQ